jgi:hypothetical protein
MWHWGKYGWGWWEIWNTVLYTVTVFIIFTSYEPGPNDFGCVSRVKAGVKIKSASHGRLMWWSSVSRTFLTAASLGGASDPVAQLPHSYVRKHEILRHWALFVLENEERTSIFGSLSGPWSGHEPIITAVKEPTEADNSDKIMALYLHEWHCATRRKVAGSIPDGVIGIFHWQNPIGRTMALGSTQPLTEMCTRSISWGLKAAGA